MKKVFNWLLVTSFAAITVLLYAPLEAVATSDGAMLFGVSDVLGFFALGTVGAALVLWLVARLLPRKIRVRFLLLLFSVSLCFYLQTNFLNPSYGVLDGQSIAWEQYAGYGIQNAIVWALVILIPQIVYCFRKKMVRTIMYAASALLSLMQVLTLTILIVGNASEGGLRQSAFPAKDFTR